jgi:uncharacterized protein with FMN-binding domain
LFAGYAAFQYLNNSTASYAATTATQQVASDQTQTLAQAFAQTQTPAQQPVQTQPQVAQTQPSQTPVQTAQPAPAPVPVAKPKGQYIDGTYTGSLANAFYGYVQVQVSVSGGRVANVQFLQYPNSHGTSVFINQQAMPILISEAIQAQNAQVNGVSGATFTSSAFQQSLASALSQAQS